MGSDIPFAAPDALVMVVDDINTNLAVARGILMLYRIQTRLCRSGPEAIEAIGAEKVDLVLMDHMMPGMDGIETVGRIRAMADRDPYYASVPIIALTANVASGAREMFLGRGFDGFMAKPMDIGELNAVLEKWIPREKQSHPLLDAPTDTDSAVDGVGAVRINGLDMGKGFSHTGGTMEKYLQTLAVFLRDGKNKLGELVDCLDRGDLPLYTVHAHALKSAAAVVGAGALSRMAGELEAAGRRGEWDFILKNNPGLLSALESLLQDIRAALEGRAAPKARRGDWEQLRSHLVDLAEAIHNVDPGFIKAAVNGIRPYAGSGEFGSSVDDILQHTLVGDYDKAASLIADLLGGAR